MEQAAQVSVEGVGDDSGGGGAGCSGGEDGLGDSEEDDVEEVEGVAHGGGHQ
jgi:hypothetical protein